MPRTETCKACGGHGFVADYGPLGADFEGDKPCRECRGNGYVPAEATIHDALQTLRDAENAEVAPLLEAPADIDLTATTPPPGRMANQTWRILEEQRQAAEDTIRECDAEIERWTNKMVDAMKTKGMCEAGQRALDGGL